MRRAALAASFVLATLCTPAEPLRGSVRDEAGKPLPHTYVGLLSPAFALVKDATTDTTGVFNLAAEAQAGFLVVQPPAAPTPSGDRVHRHQPRLYQLDPARQGELALVLPTAATLVIEAYSAEGRLLRWEDFAKRGTLGGQFIYAANLDDIMIPTAIWPVHGKLTGADSGPREKGLPGVLSAPGVPVCISALFWKTAGYGKLLLRADNSGKGFILPAPGDARRIELNVEFARTAVADLNRRKSVFLPEAAAKIAPIEAALAAALGATDAPARAKLADAVLVDALRLRDALELEAARAAIPRVRTGTLHVTLRGADAAKCKIQVRQTRRQFVFTAFEGSPYNAAAFRAARDAGFEWAVALLGWNWTKEPRLNKGGIDSTYGISALEKLGFRLKSHGSVWMQDYGILPDEAKSLPAEQLAAGALGQQRDLLEVFGSRFDLWEAINEPGTTNVTSLPRNIMVNLMSDSASAIKAAGKPSLVNSPHEFSYGAKYTIHSTANAPLDDYPLTFLEFLRQSDMIGALSEVDIIGLQFYPGFHLSAEWGDLQGPAMTPSFILDTIERYTRFGKPIHITELSLPSSFEMGWSSGYWREPWTEATQADYVEAVFTLAFGHPGVQGAGWWDISDAKPAVITGGLVRKDGTPKPAYDRLKALLASWSTQAELTADAQGAASVPVFAGDYEIKVTGPGGKSATATVSVAEGAETTTEVTL